MKVALATSADYGLMDEAWERYHIDVRSAGDTSETNWNTWQELHYAYWHPWDPSQDALPLTPLKLHIVGCLFKAGGYRTTKNYLSIAHQKHVEAGASWTEQLELAGEEIHVVHPTGHGALETIATSKL